MGIGGALSPVVKRPGREADHSLPSSAEAKKVGAKPPLLHTSSWRKGKAIPVTGREGP
jgi:hypothetical protein